MITTLPDVIVLGTTQAGRPTSYALSPRAQSYHALCWGSTGMGKSKLLQAIFLQHLTKGGGVGLIDPHSDLALDCLSFLVGRGYFRDLPDAFERLVYLDFGNGSFVPFNVLKTPYDPHTTALNALEAMTRTWPDLNHAPLFRTLFLSSVLTLIANRLPLTCIYQLLLDTPFRARCLEAVSDPLVHQTLAYYSRHGLGQAASTLRRMFLLSFSPVSRYSLGQMENLLDMRALMDAGKCLLVNLGTIADPITRRLLGAMLMVQIEQAALSRADLAPSHRRPWTLLADEWATYGAQADTLESILTQTRKFNLRLYLSAQTLAQVDSARLAGALENCRLSITFRLGRESAEIQAKQIGQADPFKIKRPATSWRGHPQFMSISEQRESWVQELQHLPPRTAFVKQHDQSAIRIRTLTIRQPPVEPEDLDRVLATYRGRYQRSRAEIERDLLTHPARPAVVEEAAASRALSTAERDILPEATLHDGQESGPSSFPELFWEREAPPASSGSG